PPVLLTPREQAFRLAAGQPFVLQHNWNGHQRPEAFGDLFDEAGLAARLATEVTRQTDDDRRQAVGLGREIADQTRERRGNLLRSTLAGDGLPRPRQHSRGIGEGQADASLAVVDAKRPHTSLAYGVNSQFPTPNSQPTPKRQTSKGSTAPRKALGNWELGIGDWDWELGVCVGSWELGLTWELGVVRLGVDCGRPAIINLYVPRVFQPAPDSDCAVACGRPDARGSGAGGGGQPAGR